MARPKDYRELIVWQKAMALARQAYLLTAELPKSESYGLRVQIRREAVSIPSYVAEGHGRLTDLQFRHFLGNARGSLNELQTQIELAADLGLLEKKSVQALMEQGVEVARLINGFLATLRTNSANAASSASTAPQRAH